MKKIITILSFGLLVFSCDVLEQEPQSQITADVIFASEEGVDAAILGLYSSLQEYGLYGAGIPLGTDQYGDVLRFGGFFEEWNQLDSRQIPTINILAFELWSDAFATINLANIIIEGAPAVEVPGYTDEEKEQDVAVAKTIRALCYFDLLRHFGEWWDQGSALGVPLVTESTGGDLSNVENVGRSSVSESWNQILTDLSDANGLLPVDGDRYFVTQGFVDAMMARYYLYTGDYANAITTATALINDDTYVLTATYAEAFSGETTSEDIFKLTYNVQDPSELATFTISREEVLPENFLVDLLDEDAFDQRNMMIGTVAGSNVIRILKYPDGANNTDPALVCRLAEMYLIRAEAEILNGGDLDAALDDINAIRTRSGAADQSYTDAADLRSKFLDETAREMFGESYRFFALVRSDVHDDILGIDDFRRIYPIPFQEVTVENSQIVQNTGYGPN